MDEVRRHDGGDLADESPSSSPSNVSGWSPRQLAFRPYSLSQDLSKKPKSLRVVVKRPVSLLNFLV